MNSYENRSIAGYPFKVETTACKKLEEYLSSLETLFSSMPEGKEVILEIESRLAQMFSDGKPIVTEADVLNAISRLGTPSQIRENLVEESARPSDSFFGRVFTSLTSIRTRRLVASFFDKVKLFLEKLSGAVFVIAGFIFFFIGLVFLFGSDSWVFGAISEMKAHMMLELNYRNQFYVAALQRPIVQIILSVLYFMPIILMVWAGFLLVKHSLRSKSGKICLRYFFAWFIVSFASLMIFLSSRSARYMDLRVYEERDAGIPASPLKNPVKKTRVIVLPNYMYGTKEQRLDSVVMTASNTMLAITSTHLTPPGEWSRISSHSAIVAGGKLYPVRSAEGVKIGEYIYNRDSVARNVFGSIFLYFDPLPENTRTFSFLEGHFPWAWHFLNVRIPKQDREVAESSEP